MDRMDAPLARDRSPGMKLLFAALIGAALTIPLLLVYALVYDRQDQSRTAQAAINAGWGGSQVIAGPVVVVPFRTSEVQSEVVNGKSVSRTVEVERLALRLAGQEQCDNADRAAGAPQIHLFQRSVRSQGAW